jgi:hypothetical protein
MLKPLNAFSVLALATPLFAHHSAAAFDLATPIVIKGVIASVRFANPHSSIMVEVVAGNGEKQIWTVENSGTLTMTRQRGPSEEKLSAGASIAACGYAPKLGPARVITGRLLILKDGPAEDWSHYGSLEACRALLK